jgi:hypothetical protein
MKNHIRLGQGGNGCAVLKSATPSSSLTPSPFLLSFSYVIAIQQQSAVGAERAHLADWMRTALAQSIHQRYSAFNFLAMLLDGGDNILNLMSNRRSLCV